MKPVRLVVVGALDLVALRAFRERIGSLCETMFDGMPDDFPPKRMALDLAAIRAQNDRIIEMLERAAAD